MRSGPTASSRRARKHAARHSIVGSFCLLLSLVGGASGCDLETIPTEKLEASPTEKSAPSQGQCDPDYKGALFGCTSDKPVCYPSSDPSTAGICYAEPQFASCHSDSECPGPFGWCVGVDQGLATGVCGRGCPRLHSCLDDHNQVDSTCAPEVDVVGFFCGSNAICDSSATKFGSSDGECLPLCTTTADCASGFACSQASSQGRPLGSCIPYCISDDQCGGHNCNLSTHLCTALDQTLNANGSSCATDVDCRSQHCIPETWGGRGGVSGYLGGFCESFCVQPPDSAYLAATLPAADCPENDVCVRDPSVATGRISRCLPRCSTDADCRANYVCVHPEAPGSTSRSQDGFCDARADALSKT